MKSLDKGAILCMAGGGTAALLFFFIAISSNDPKHTMSLLFASFIATLAMVAFIHVIRDWKYISNNMKAKMLGMGTLCACVSSLFLLNL
jgi:hypothetical protein